MKLSDYLKKLPPQQQAIASAVADQLLQAGQDTVEAYFAAMQAGDYLRAFRLVHRLGTAQQRRARSAELRQLGIALNHQTAVARARRDALLRAIAAVAISALAAKAGI